MQNVRESMKTQRTNPGRVRCQVLRMLDYLVARAPTFVQELAREARLSTVVPTRSILQIVYDLGTKADDVAHFRSRSWSST
jgi:hypothetical protein